MSLGWAGDDLQRSASCQNLKFPYWVLFLILYICRFTLNLCGLICIEVMQPPQEYAVVIYLHVALLRRSRRLNLRWSRMHRRSPAPPRCATVSPPPLCTCSRCSCPPENIANMSNPPELVKCCTESLWRFCLQRVVLPNLQIISALHFFHLLALIFPCPVENQPMNNMWNFPLRVAWFSNQVGPNIAAI